MAGTAQHAIFIGYRREDSQDTAGRIYDRLVTAFGEPDVFKDVDNLPIGTDFGDYILGLLPKCRVFLALIGPGWLEARDASGARRIDNPADWVRIEIETALATRGLQVVPVLVNGARMPREDELPASLRRLARFNAAVVRRDPDFHVDMTRIVAALKDRVAPAPPPAPPSVDYERKTPRRKSPPYAALGLVGVVLIGAAIWFITQVLNPNVRALAERETEMVANQPPPVVAESGVATRDLLPGQWGSPGGGCADPYRYAIDGDTLTITGAQWRSTARIGAERDGWLDVTALTPADMKDQRFAYRVDGGTLTVRDGAEKFDMQACR